MLRVGGVLFGSLRFSSEIQLTKYRHAFHLLHHMLTKHPIGYLAAVRKYCLAPADEVKFRLLDAHGSDLGKTSLTDALPCIKPGAILSQATTLGGDPKFQIVPLKLPVLPPMSARDKDLRRKFPTTSKKIHFSITVPASHFRYIMAQCYQLLLKGERVEVGLHRARRTPDHMTFDWAIRHHPHLRPDTILKAMPEGTRMIAHPCRAPDLLKAKGPNAAAPLQWGMECEPSSQRIFGGKIPPWMMRMGTWDVEMQLDPEQEENQSVKHMYHYSLRLHNEKARQRNAQTESAVN